MNYLKPILIFLGLTVFTQAFSAAQNVTLNLVNSTKYYIYLNLQSHKCFAQVDRFDRKTILPKGYYKKSMNFRGICSSDPDFSIKVSLCETAEIINCKATGYLYYKADTNKPVFIFKSNNEEFTSDNEMTSGNNPSLVATFKFAS